MGYPRCRSKSNSSWEYTELEHDDGVTQLSDSTSEHVKLGLGETSVTQVLLSVMKQEFFFLATHPSSNVIGPSEFSSCGEGLGEKKSSIYSSSSLTRCDGVAYLALHERQVV